MTNAKSRLVRIIALALAVLMVVPMALVGCKKTDAGVDQAAIDAAIKEALDAAQKAQDAADKAAQDAKDAQDKLAAAEKEAADLQGQIDAMKNTTTAAPATTTKAPAVSEDAKVLDAYIATMLNDDKSDYKKLVWAYGIMDGYAYADADVETINGLIKTAEVAIQRAPSSDYVNSIVATLKADLDAVPTYAERIFELYSAIDFAANDDVIDVVKAANLADIAYNDLKAVETMTALSSGLEGYEEVEKATLETLKAEYAALTAFGADALDLATLVNQEYYRYTGNTAKVSNADTYVPVDEVLYQEVYDDVASGTIAADIVAIYGSALAIGAELKVSDIVYDNTLTITSDSIKNIYEDYSDLYAEYRKDYAELQDAFETAFVGEAYVLTQEGNYLRTKLDEAKARVLELEAAAKEYNKNSFKQAMANIVSAFTLTATADPAVYESAYLYTNKKDVDKVNDILVAWIAKYNFTENDPNLAAIIGTATLNTFKDAKAYVDFVNEWADKAKKIGADAVEDLVDEYNDNIPMGGTVGSYDYVKYGNTALAFETWRKGTYDDKATAYKANGIDKAVTTLPSGTKAAISAANINEIYKKVFGFATTAAVTNADAALITYFRTTLLPIVKVANDNNKTMAKIDLEKVVLGSKEYATAESVLSAIYTYCLTTIAAGVEEYEDDGITVKEWDMDSANIGLVNWDLYAELAAAKKAASLGNAANAVEIIKAYIAAAIGTDCVVKVEDGVIEYTRTENIITPPATTPAPVAVKYEFDIAPDAITIKDYELVKSLASIYDAVNVAATAGVTDDIIVEDVDGEEVKFDFDDAVKMYRVIYDNFYYSIMDASDVDARKVKFSGVVNGGSNADNDWMANFATSDDPSVDYTASAGTGANVYNDATVKFGDLVALFGEISAYLGEYAPEFRFVGAKDVNDWDNDGNKTEANSASSAKDGSVINIYKTKEPQKPWGVTYSYHEAILSVSVDTYATFSAEGKVTGFDKAGYYKAVTAAIDSYYTNWLKDYNKNNSKATTTAQTLVDYLVAYGVWEIEDTFMVDGYDYKFAITSNGTAANIVVYDDEGYIVKNNVVKGEDASGNDVYYQIKFATNQAYNGAEKYAAGSIWAATPVAPIDKANVKILVDQVTVDANGNITGTVAANVALAKVVDENELGLLTYVYEVEDSIEAIKANIKLMPNNLKMVDSTYDKYVIVTAEYLDKTLDAYKARDFYNTLAAYYAAAAAYKAAIGTPSAETTKAFAEYEVSFKPGNVTYGGSATAELVVAAYEKIVREMSVFN